MPDVQEVFRMATQKVRPEPGFVDRQQRHQRRKQRNRKIGAFVVAGAITVAAVALILVTLPGDDAQVITPPSSVDSAEAKAEAVAIANDFVDAFGAFDGEQAITYLSDNPILQMNPTSPGEIPGFTSFLEAQGYEQIRVDDCAATGDSTTNIAVTCPFDWHAIRSAEIGLGPYPGSWDITVRDGEISAAALIWDTERFGPQMWEPFRDWVRENHPDDFDVMYILDGGDFSFTEESARLWERHSRAYVEELTS